MLKNYNIETISAFILSGAVFFLPLVPKISVIFILLFFVIVVSREQFWNSFTLSAIYLMGLFPVLFYILHVTGLLYSDNMPYALADLETKASFLVFPLLMPSLKYKPADYKLISISFILGCLIGGILSLQHALQSYFTDYDIKDLVYMKYSYLLHTTYFTMYLNFAIIILLEITYDSWKTISTTRKAVYVLSLFFMMFNIILISARTGTAVAFGTVILYAFYLIYKSKKIVKGGSVLMICFICFGLMEYKAMKIGSDRTAQIESIIEQKESNYNSANIRIYLWKNSFEVIRENLWFGVGTGDIKEELIAKYKKNNFTVGIERNYSPHNQFIHTTVILGIIGLLILLAIFAVPFFLALKNMELDYVFLLLVVFLNCFTEDIIEVQKGILFFSIFYSLFYCRSIHRKEFQFNHG